MVDPIIRYFRNQRGYARMKALKEAGFQTREIRKLVDQGRLAKVKAGLYRLSDIRPGEKTGLVEICLSMPKAVICLSSALAFHELTTHIPPSITVAIPISGKPVRLSYPPSQVYFFSENQYKAGIERHETQEGQIRVYGPEKTVCDLFRFRNKLGEDLALEGLKEYLKRPSRDLGKLMKSAQVCRVHGMISQYVKAIVG